MKGLNVKWISVALLFADLICTLRKLRLCNPSNSHFCTAVGTQATGTQHRTMKAITVHSSTR